MAKNEKSSDSIRDICIDIDDTDYYYNLHRDQEYVYMGLSVQYDTVNQNRISVLVVQK